MLRFEIFGFPVSVHWPFWLVCFFLGNGLMMKSAADFYRVLLWTISLFLSILVHELGHAFVGRKYGAVPAIHLHGLGGLTAFPSTWFSRRQHIAVTAAGPASSFAFAMASLLVVSIIPPTSQQGLWRLALLLFVINLFLTILNLLPILPLDGGQILRDLLGPKRREVTRWTGVFFAAAAALWAFSIGQIFLGILLAYLGFLNYDRQEPRIPGY